MPPKPSSPRRIVYRTVRAKELAEQRAAASTATGALSHVLEKWNALPSEEKTPAKAIVLTAESCVGLEKLTVDPVYTGSVKFSRELGLGSRVGLPLISQSVLDLYVAMRARAGVPISERALETALFPEYATNISFANGRLNVVTNKYVGMEFLPGTESIIISEDDEDASFPCDILVDFLFNCLFMKLCTLKDIEEFVSQEVWEGARAYLLSDKQVLQLVRYGVHEKFDAAALEDSMVVARECAAVFGALFPKVHQMAWSEVEEAVIAVPEAVHREEEYIA